MKPLNDTVAANLRAEIARHYESRAALARDMGVTSMWLSRRVSGKTPITIEDLDQFAAALDVPVAHLLGDPRKAAS